MIPRQEALLIVTLVALVGSAAVLVHAFRTRAHGPTIRFQIFALVALLTLIVTAGFGVIVVDRFQARIHRFARQAAADDARVVVTLVERSLELTGLSLEQGSASLAKGAILYAFSDELRDTRVQLLDAQQRVLFDTLSIADGAANLESYPAADAVEANVPIRSRGRVIGAAVVTKSVESMRTVLSDLVPKVSLLALILAMTAAAVGRVMGSSLATPLERLTEAANRVAHGERQMALPRPRGREVRRLTDAFERMRSELEQRDQLEALATNLSHELKNPVAAIRASAEVLDDAIDHDAAAAKRFAARILEASERMGHLIGDLLDLTRLEARGLTDGDDRFEPQAVVAAALSGLELRGREVHTEIETLPTPLSGNPTWLARALSNLLHNAIRHAPPDSDIAVRGERRRGSYRFSVVDGGPGVPPALEDRVFERFVTTQGEGGGSGLGLAIVRSVAEAHGGGAGLEQEPGRTEFFLTIPL
ncbi:MAG: ATP-binding protein [Myxococcota bacterium]